MNSNSWPFCFPFAPFIRLPPQMRDFLLVLFEITVSGINGILRWVSVLYADPFSACSKAVEQYIKCVTSIFIVPFAYYYDCNRKDHGPNRGIPMLRTAHGYRKLLTCFVHLIVVIRTCWAPFVFNQKFQAKHHGMFTSDFCFVATICLTAIAMIVIWLKAWRHTAVFCWLHNSYCKINRDFSGEPAIAVVAYNTTS